MEESKYKLGISFSMQRRRILVYHDTLRALGEPSYIRFLLNKDARRLALQACRYGENGYHEVGEYKNDRWSFEINSMDLVRLLRKICGWRQDCTYRVIGTVIQQHQLVEFDLNMAEPVTEEETESMIPT